MDGEDEYAPRLSSWLVSSKVIWPSKSSCYMLILTVRGHLLHWLAAPSMAWTSPLRHSRTLWWSKKHFINPLRSVEMNLRLSQANWYTTHRGDHVHAQNPRNVSYRALHFFNLLINCSCISDPATSGISFHARLDQVTGLHTRV